MKLGIVTSFFAAGFLVLAGGARPVETVTVDGHTARVVSAPADGLEGLVSTSLELGPSAAFAGCTSWDVKDNCCPAGCAAKNGTQWSKADQILRACMKGLGCSDSDSKSATVFMKCDCPKPKK